MTGIWAIFAGLASGVLAGGSVRRLATLRLEFELVLLVSFVVQGIARGRLIGTTPISWSIALWIGVSVLLVVLLGLNRAHRGAVVAACGVVLNMNVVLLNHGMPVNVAPTPVALAGIAASGGFYHLAGVGTVASWAADTLPLGMWGHTYFLSVGDVLLGVGIVVLVADAMIGPRVCSRGEEDA